MKFNKNIPILIPLVLIGISLLISGSVYAEDMSEILSQIPAFQTERYIIAEEVRCADNAVLSRYVFVYELESADDSISVRKKALEGKENDVSYLLANPVDVEGTLYKPLMESRAKDDYMYEKLNCPSNLTKVNYWSFGLDKPDSATEQESVPGIEIDENNPSYQVLTSWWQDPESGSTVTGYKVIITDPEYTSAEDGSHQIVREFSSGADIRNIYTSYSITEDGVSYRVYRAEADPVLTNVEESAETGIRTSISVYSLEKISVDKVVWDDQTSVGVSISGDSLTKTATTGWSNSGARSIQTIPGDGRMEFMAYETTTYRMCGLSNEYSEGSQLGIDCGILVRPDRYVAVYEDGEWKGKFMQYSPGDVFIAERSGSTVYYKVRRSGTTEEQTFYTSSKSSYGTLMVDAALYTQGATIRNTKIFTESVSPTPTVSPVPSCGDGLVNQPNEECDGTALEGKACLDFGLRDGTLSCDNACTFDTSQCEYCGDGIKNGLEACDEEDVGTATCQSLGYEGGTLGCYDGCRLDTSGCYDICGNSHAGKEEECDGSDLNGESCQSLGFDGGSLYCWRSYTSSKCTFNTSRCYHSSTPSTPLSTTATPSTTCRRYFMIGTRKVCISY